MYELRKKTEKIKRVSKGSGKNLRLVERDFRALRFVLEMKICSSLQIWEQFYRGDGIGIKYVQNRLSRLRRGDYLFSHFTYDGPVKYYSASQKARDVVMSFFGLEDYDIPEGRSHIDLSQFIHDKGLSWLRIFLERSGAIDEWSWYSELEDKHRKAYGKKIKDVRFGVIPDAKLPVSNDDWVAVEFENSLKSRTRRREKLENLIINEKSTFKFFVFANDSIRKAWEETFRQYFLDRAKEKILNSRSDTCRLDKELSWFQNFFNERMVYCATYDEIVEKYESKGDARMNLVDFLSKEKSFIDGEKYVQFEIEAQEEMKKASEEERIKHNEMIILAEKKRKESDQRLFGRLFR